RDERDRPTDRPVMCQHTAVSYTCEHPEGERHGVWLIPEHLRVTRLDDDQLHADRNVPGRRSIGGIMNRTKQRGQALMFFGVGILVFFALAALAVDVGRQVFIGREAQAAADSAALAGVGALARGGGDTQAILAAQSVALQNSVNKTPAVVSTADVFVGLLNCRVFTGVI